MPQAIIRVAKIKTAGAARGKTAHNYRLMDTPNADPDRTKPLNQEYVNTGRADYWTLAEQRIAEVVTRKVRDDQVRAMEVVLTASPDWFKRGQDGQAEDIRESKWVADNLHFLKEKFGEKNVVSFTLHQDEKTPHVHAVVIPITDQNRLSADTLFNPKTLVKLQTEYAAAMAPHGLERGIEGSRRQHQDMKQVYSHQEKTAAELAPLVQPVAVQAFTLPDVPLMGRDTWRAEQEATINAEIARQVGEANQRLERAGNVAVAHAGSSEQAETLARQLAISQGLKQGHFTDLQARDKQVDWLYDQQARVSVQLAQGGGTLSKQLEDEGKLRTENARKELVSVVEKTLTKPIRDQAMFLEELKKAGWTLGQDGIVNEKNGAVFKNKDISPNGLDLAPQLMAAYERTNAAEFAQSAAGKLAAEQAERQARGQQAHEGRAVLEMDAKDVETIKKNFLDVRAGVRPGQVLADGRVQLEIVYQHTQPTIRSINDMLNKAQKWTGVTVQEDSHDREHRQVGAERRGQELKTEKSRGKSQDRGQTIG